MRFGCRDARGSGCGVPSPPLTAAVAGLLLSLVGIKWLDRFGLGCVPIKALSRITRAPMCILLEGLGEVVPSETFFA